MSDPNSFEKPLFDTVLNGLSAIDLPRLQIKSLQEAKDFVRSYGYDMNDERDLQALWSYHRRAVTLIQEELLGKDEKIPEKFTDPRQLQDLSSLLIVASSERGAPGSDQAWACAVLRMMHVLVHLSNDMFANFGDEIQTQILKPIQDHIHRYQGTDSLCLGQPETPDAIALQRFDVKPAKTPTSSVIKLLAKKELVALRLLDRLGIRFVTKSTYDAFRVVTYLLQNHLISFPHIIPDQSNNTLYPLNLFLEIIQKHPQPIPPDEWERLLVEKLKTSIVRAEFNQKNNDFTAPEFRFIKFIVRKLIRCDNTQHPAAPRLNFFYPYEIQIMTNESYILNLTGSSAHEEYKKRQRQVAHLRILGLPNESP